VEPLQVLLTVQQDANPGMLLNFRESCVQPFYARDTEVGSFKQKEGEEGIAGPFKMVWVKSDGWWSLPLRACCFLPPPPPLQK
jgi:hypothetical protein